MAKYEDIKWRENMKLRLDYNNMMADFIGAQYGLTRNDLLSKQEMILNAAHSLDKKRKEGKMSWRELPYQNEVVSDIIDTADYISNNYDNFVVLGIGGSALGPIAVHNALSHSHYNELPREKRNGKPRFYVLDNIDPERMSALFDILDVRKSVFNVVTKSGSTSETIAQFLYIKNILEKAVEDNVSKQIIAVTDERKGSLIQIAKDEGYKTFYVPDGVGGRFSELSPVGLLPAAVCGIDIKELLAGAAFMDDICCSGDVNLNPAFMGGLLHYLAMLSGKNISVMMPYADSLKFMADWYAQLWAESLGKKYSNDGIEVYSGQTPVKALGVTDQHSQIQLYVEGPYDKVITFLTVDNFRQSIRIPEYYKSIPEISFLGGHSFNELMKNEQIATEFALVKANRPNMTIRFNEVNEFTIGQFIYMLEVQTAFTGELLNINAFDQPGVEEGKEATYALMGKQGYESKRLELKNRKQKLERFVI